ncbi:MAG: hypothetical protein H0V10_02835 [Geodermatophilaceae bacterium]|nr:hypothetical protein [Geodermatophilaceae bacterium]
MSERSERMPVSDDRAIHDLLERAVRGHMPMTIDPEQVVAALARRERRRSVLLTALATLIVIVGGAGVLNVVEARTRGDGPVAGPSDKSAAWQEGQPEDALGRDTVINLENGLVLSLPAPLVVTPPGWTEFPPDSATELDASVLACPAADRVVYRVTVSGPGIGGDESPCIGVVVAPYIWERADRSPPVTGPLTVTALDDGTPVWLLGLGDGRIPVSIAPRHTVFLPASGQSAQAGGIPIDEFLTYLAPVSRTVSAFEVPHREPDLTARVRRSASPNSGHVVSDQDLSDLLTELELTAASDEPPCRHVNSMYQIEFRIAESPVALIVVDNMGGCATALSSRGGGSARVSPGLVPLLVGLSLDS